MGFTISIVKTSGSFPPKHTYSTAPSCRSLLSCQREALTWQQWIRATVDESKHVKSEIPPDAIEFGELSQAKLQVCNKNEAQWWPSLPVCEQAGSSHLLIDFTQSYSASLKNILPAIGPKCQGIRSSVFSFPSCKCDILFQCTCQAFTLYFHRG